MSVDLAGDVTLEHAHDLELGTTFFGAPLDIGARRKVANHPGHDDAPQGAVGLAVATAVESMTGDLARRRLDGRHAAQVRPGRLRTQPAWVVARGDQQ